MKSPFLASVNFRNIITFPATLFEDVRYTHLYLEYDPLQSWAGLLPSKKSFDMENIPTLQLQTFFTDLLYRHEDLQSLQPLLTNLQCLKTSPTASQRDLQKLSNIIDICANSLERISLTSLTDEDPMWSRSLNISTMTSLKSLSIDCEWTFRDPHSGDREDGLSNIYTFFNISHAMNNLIDSFSDLISIQMLLSLLSGAKYPALRLFSLTVQVISGRVHVRDRLDLRKNAEADHLLGLLEEVFKSTSKKVEYRLAMEWSCPFHVKSAIS
ncbi:hypothetical protein CPB84DRAFT_1792672 [Gymnopilus junonius]|uniref:Uncharacterized protein n=1 Tax=Gymnopilus junonius TaxID=109634 RepID=A0A9P5TH43_GYMJU|nr:hypothetical protein CPB84DRAFT_1792672 [Gymnopilus junonius]